MKSDPTYPVAWVMYSDFGIVFNRMTLPEHRNQGLSFAISASTASQMLSQGIVPVSEHHREDEVPFRLTKYILESTWRDSITGECYW